MNKKITIDNFHLLIKNKDISSARKVFRKFQDKKSKKEIFYHLCFVILISQAKWSSVKEIVNQLIINCYYEKNIKLDKLIELIKKSRFKNRKANYLECMKFRWFNTVYENLNKEKDTNKKRDFIVTNIKGLGMKTASHFLRNMGESNLAIIDTHILKFLKKDRSPKNKKEYLELEEEFKKFSKELNVEPAISDMIVWKNYADIEWSEFNY